MYRSDWGGCLRQSMSSVQRATCVRLGVSLFFTCRNNKKLERLRTSALDSKIPSTSIYKNWQHRFATLRGWDLGFLISFICESSLTLLNVDISVNFAQHLNIPGPGYEKQSRCCCKLCKQTDCVKWDQVQSKSKHSKRKGNGVSGEGGGRKDDNVEGVACAMSRFGIRLMATVSVSLASGFQSPFTIHIHIHPSYENACIVCLVKHCHLSKVGDMSYRKWTG